MLHFRKLSPMYFVIDLNLDQVKSMLPRDLRKELLDECWPIDLFTTGGLSSCVRVSPMRCPLQGRLQTQEFLLLGPVSLHGLRPANISRKLARHRSLSAGQSNKALSHGHSWSRLAQHAGQRQLGTRLAHLRRLRSLADPTSPSALPGRRVQPGFAANCLRPGCHDHRSVPVAVSLGLLSQTERGHQTAHSARPARQHSYGNHYYSRPDSRGQHSRSANFRSRRLLSNGSGLSRFSPLTPTSFGLGLLHHARPQTFPLSATLLSAGRPHHRYHVRSDRHPDQSRSSGWLPGQTAPHSLFRSPAGKIFLTNNFTLPPLTVAQLYRSRWQVELFFKWIKQHLRIKNFYGTSENSLRTQIWIAISVYVLVAIVKKELHLDASLFRMLQICSVTLFEKTPISQALSLADDQTDLDDLCKQLILFH